jgi:hypothetical protein
MKMGVKMAMKLRGSRGKGLLLLLLLPAVQSAKLKRMMQK